MCLIASVCFCAAENCWAKFSVVFEHNCIATDRSTGRTSKYPRSAIEGGEGGRATGVVSGSERCHPRSSELIIHLSCKLCLTEQATETVTIRTFSKQKPWVDRTIRDAVNHRTAAYNAGLLSGNMSKYKASCYALRRAVRAAKLRYRERIESHFQLNDSQRMWQGLKTICSSGNKSSAEMRADPLLAKDLNTFYGRFECKWRLCDSADHRVRKQQTEQR